MIELRPPRPLAEVVESVLRPAAALRRDVRVPAELLDVRDGHLFVGREAFPLRPGAARQLRSLAGVPARSPSVDVRRALAARGEREVLVRLDGREVRAVVGKSFARLDDLDIFARLARAIASMGWRDDLLVRLVVETDAATVVRLTLRRSRATIRPGDEFERGIEFTNGETGRHAFMLTPITFRLGCWNFSRATRPTLRLVHAGDGHRYDRDLCKDIASGLEAARSLLHAWRSSTNFDVVNSITDRAKSRSLTGRLQDERRAQGLIEDASRHG